MISAQMIAVVPVRDGVVPLGADETVAECGGVAVVIGTGAARAAAQIRADLIIAVEGVIDDPLAVADALAGHVAHARVIVLPATPDGRDLAPVLAVRLARPLVAGAIEVRVDGASAARSNGLVTEAIRVDGPFVATLIPGVRGVDPTDGSTERAPVRVVEEATIAASSSCASAMATVRILPPDPATMDLAEASVIVAGGSGLGSKERFDRLGAVGRSIGASLGGTRVASDAGWIPFERQIGTTGVSVAPRTYLAFAISGATQHVTGLGDPDHVISVNTDPSCPMMSMADLAIVSDARAVLDELAHRLGIDVPGRAVPDPADRSDPGSTT